jgi:hypothetical protein
VIKLQTNKTMPSDVLTLVTSITNMINGVAMIRHALRKHPGAAKKGAVTARPIPRRSPPIRSSTPRP